MNEFVIPMTLAAKLAEAEARLARLRPVVRAAKRINELCAIGGEDSGSVGIPADFPDDINRKAFNSFLDAVYALNETFFKTTAADRAWALGSEQEGRSDG